MPRPPCLTPTRRASLLLALAAVVSPWCHAQGSAVPTGVGAAAAWPTKPLRIIVGFPAGTSPDLTARAFSEPLSKALGQPVQIKASSPSSVLDELLNYLITNTYSKLPYLKVRQADPLAEIRAVDDELAAVDAEALAQLQILLDVLAELAALALDDHRLRTIDEHEDTKLVQILVVEHDVEVAEALRQDPDVTGVSAFIGAGSMNPTLNQGQLSIVLKERSQRDGLDEILPRLQKAVAGIPGVALYLKPVQDVTLDTRVAATEYQYSLSDVDSTEVATQATRLTEALRKRPELADVDNNLSNQGRALELNIDRDKASVLGVPMQTIDDTLYDAFGQRQISTIFTELNQYRVVLEVAPEFRTSTALMEQLAVASNGAGALTGTNATSFGQVTSSNSSTATGIGAQNTGITVGAGNIIPLSALAEGKVSSAPLVVSHQQQLPAVTVSFNVAPGYSLSEAVRAIQETKDSLDMPAHLHAEFIGKAAEFTGSQTDVVWLLLASLVVIYIVLGVLYESYIHPLTILSTLPSAGVGALLALYVTGGEFSLISLLGLFLLIGVVKKNAILMIDLALQLERHQGFSPEESIRRACLLRLRPILMTTLAAILGALPLLLSRAEGAEMRQPLGLTIIGGLVFSQVLTLYTTPVVYLYLDRLRHRFNRWRGVRTDAALETPL